MHLMSQFTAVRERDWIIQKKMISTVEISGQISAEQVNSVNLQHLLGSSFISYKVKGMSEMISCIRFLNVAAFI